VANLALSEGREPLAFASTRRTGGTVSVLYGIVGCLFGFGIFVGALIVNAREVFATAVLFFAICFAATILASKRPVGTVLLERGDLARCQ
jgi:hypothetical protein